MTGGWSARTAAAAGLIGLAAIGIGAASEGSSPLTAVARYDFESPADTGSEALEVFEQGKSRVRLRRAPRRRPGGAPSNPRRRGRVVEIADRRGDDAFPELRVNLPERRAGRVRVRFALMTTTPAETFHVALAGRGGYFFDHHGSAVMLHSEGGVLYHRPAKEKEALIALRAGRWTGVEAVYDIDRGTYNLRLWPEGLEAVVREGCRNGPDRPRSSINNVSFISSYDDSSAAVFYVDDIEVAVDGPAVDPLVAPGRRRLHFDMWADYRRFELGRALCPRVEDLGELGFEDLEQAALAEQGSLIRVAGMANTPSSGGGESLPPGLPPGSPSGRALALWRKGCFELERPDYPAARRAFEQALQTRPRALLLALSVGFIDAAYRLEEDARARLAPLRGELVRRAGHAYWLALASGDPVVRALAIERLRPVAEGLLAEADSPLFDLAASGGSVTGRRTAFEEPFPERGPSSFERALSLERYHELLVWAGEPEAGQFARRVLERLRALARPAGVWIEGAGDGAFACGRWEEARQFYEQALSEGTTHSLRAKLSDVAFRLGDLRAEKRWREEVYGSLR